MRRFSGSNLVVPNVGWPGWEQVTTSLCDRLRRPATIDELVRWCLDDRLFNETLRSMTRGAYRESILNNMLAWLSVSGRVRYDCEGCVWELGSDFSDCCDSHLVEALQQAAAGG